MKTSRLLATATIGTLAASACGLDTTGKNQCAVESDCLIGHTCTTDRQCVPTPDAGTPMVDAPTVDAPTVDAPTGPSLVRTHRIARITLPEYDEQNAELGLDLDRDALARIDNRWHRTSWFLTDLAWYPQGALENQLDSEELIVLGELRTTGSLATLVLRVGRRHPTASDQYEALPGAPPLGELSGTLEAGRLSVGPGPLKVPLRLLTGLGPSVYVDLVGARIEVASTDSPDGWAAARLGGGLQVASYVEQVPPLVAALAQQIVEIDCPDARPPACCADPATTGARLLRDYNDDADDCTISAGDIEAHAAFRTSYAADVDLLDASGQYGPRSDGNEDCIAVGVGLGTVRAAFPTPLP